MNTPRTTRKGAAATGLLADHPPQDIEREMAVLGSMMIGGKPAILEAQELLAAGDFYRNGGTVRAVGFVHVRGGAPRGVVKLF